MMYTEERFKNSNILAKSKLNSKIPYPVYQGRRCVQIMKKGGRKSRDTLPLTLEYQFTCLNISTFTKIQLFVFMSFERTLKHFLMLLLWTPFFMFNFFLDFQSKASLKKKLSKITLLQCSTFFVYCVLGLLSILYTKNYFVRGVQRLF